MSARSRARSTESHTGFDRGQNGANIEKGRSRGPSRRTSRFNKVAAGDDRMKYLAYSKKISTRKEKRKMAKLVKKQKKQLHQLRKMRFRRKGSLEEVSGSDTYESDATESDATESDATESDAAESGPEQEGEEMIAKAKRKKVEIEDARLKWLEKKLGISKGRMDDVDDGLDSLLDGICVDEEADASKNKNRKRRDQKEIYGESWSSFDGAVDSSDNMNNTSDTKRDLDTLRVTLINLSDYPEELVRELRGNINRLSESNMISTLESVESFYFRYPRKQVNQLLARYFLDECVLRVKTAQGAHHDFSFALVYAGLVSSLHLILGADVGGHFLEQVSREFQWHLDHDDTSVCRNLILVFSYLYQFDLVHFSTVCQFIRHLVHSMNESNVDLLLLLIQNVGSRLRKADPTAPREIERLVKQVSDEWREENARIGEVNSVTEPSGNRGNYSKRVQFIIESLSNFKKMNTDQTARLSQLIKQYFKQRFKKSAPVPEPIQISWEHLLYEEKKGRSWLIGSTFQTPSHLQNVKDGGHVDSDALQSSDSDIKRVLTLARTHHINTESRKCIFTILLTSEDYMDAFEKLMRIYTTKQFYQDVASVLVHCCMYERRYNPYYALLAHKLCSFDKSVKFYFRCCFWDMSKSLDSHPTLSVSNLAKLYAYLLGNQALTLSVVRRLDLSNATPMVMLFLKLLLTAVFVNFDSDAVSSLFSRLSLIEDDDSAHTKNVLEALLLTVMNTVRPELAAQALFPAEDARQTDAAELMESFNQKLGVAKRALSEH